MQRGRGQILDGIRFDSQAEVKRYRELKLLLAAGQIEALVVHPKYTLHVDGTKIGTYAPDFRYTVTATAEEVVEDAKGDRRKTKARKGKAFRRRRRKGSITDLFKWKCKHLAAEYGLTVQIIYR